MSRKKSAVAFLASLVIGGSAVALAAAPARAMNPCANTFCQLQDPNTIVCVYYSGWACAFSGPDVCNSTHC